MCISWLNELISQYIFDYIQCISTNQWKILRANYDYNNRWHVFIVQSTNNRWPILIETVADHAYSGDNLFLLFTAIPSHSFKWLLHRKIIAWAISLFNLLIVTSVCGNDIFYKAICKDRFWNSFKENLNPIFFRLNMFSFFTSFQNSPLSASNVNSSSLLLPSLEFVWLEVTVGMGIPPC